MTTHFASAAGIFNSRLREAPHQHHCKIGVLKVCVGTYANPPHAFTDIYAVLNYFAYLRIYIYCVYILRTIVYVSLYAKKSARLGI